MNQRIASAIFDHHAEAERALAELRAAGVEDRAISVIARQGGTLTQADGTGEAEDVNKSGALKGALAGAGVGTLLGIAALAIPGVGPLAAAGAIAGSAIPEAAAIGAAAGATAGGLTGLLSKHGIDDDNVRYYEGRINEGGIFVSVDTENSDLSYEDVQAVLHRSGGHNASTTRTAAI